MTDAKVVFLYPVASTGPIGVLCGDIVRELEWRDFAVPGFDLVFGLYGRGEDKRRYVRVMTGPNFQLEFGSIQATPSLPGSFLLDRAGVKVVNIPQKTLTLDEEGATGPTYREYRGDNWARDREAFVARSEEVAATYLYHPRLARTKRYDTAQTYDEIAKWLTRNVLEPLRVRPVPAKHADPFAEAVIPFPAMIGPLYCLVDGFHHGRITTGKTSPKTLPRGERYGVASAWCGFGDTAEPDGYCIRCLPGWDFEEVWFAVRITPDRANGIYVVGVDTDGAIRRIPIAEYDGTLEYAMVEVTRELGLGEVEPVSSRYDPNARL